MAGGVWRWVVAVAGGIALAGCGLGSATLRPDGGVLDDCAGRTPCVSSRAAQAGQQVPPLRYSSSAAAAQRQLVELLVQMPGVRIRQSQPGYLHAEFRSPLMRYVDDVEFELLDDGLIHVRSASRIGLYDFGVNRRRVEDIREQFHQRQP